MEPHHGHPSPWVTTHLSGARAGGNVLDLACGNGRHLRYALSRGYRVTGVDRTLTGVADLRSDDRVALVEADLEAGHPWPLGTVVFDAVIVTNYLWRPIFSGIVGAVAANGVLIYETFARGNERFGSPRNPDFLLLPGELVDRVRPRLMPIAFEHVLLREPDRLVQRIVAVGPDHEWLTRPPRARS